MVGAAEAARRRGRAAQLGVDRVGGGLRRLDLGAEGDALVLEAVDADHELLGAQQLEVVRLELRADVAARCRVVPPWVITPGQSGGPTVGNVHWIACECNGDWVGTIRLTRYPGG